jgi:hypothetical protein
MNNPVTLTVNHSQTTTLETNKVISNTYILLSTAYC